MSKICWLFSCFLLMSFELVFEIKMIGDTLVELADRQTSSLVRSNNNPAPKQRGSQLAPSTFLSIFSHNLDIEKAFALLQMCTKAVD